MKRPLLPISEFSKWQKGKVGAIKQCFFISKKAFQPTLLMWQLLRSWYINIFLIKILTQTFHLHKAHHQTYKYMACTNECPAVSKQAPVQHNPTKPPTFCFYFTLTLSHSLTHSLTNWLADWCLIVCHWMPASTVGLKTTRKSNLF